MALGYTMSREQIKRVSESTADQKLIIGSIVMNSITIGFDTSEAVMTLRPKSVHMKLGPMYDKCGGASKTPTLPLSIWLSRNYGKK